MGGFGSGKCWMRNSKETTEDYRAIDVRRWQREGLLKPGKSFVWRWEIDGRALASIQVSSVDGAVELDYRYRRGGMEWQPAQCRVGLDWTPCHLGGQRPWFRCPSKGCGRRVAVLYCGGLFACRRCYRLVYASQREARADRLARRAERIRGRLGWEPGILNGDGHKPKGMHWKTFRRLREQHNDWVDVWLASMEARIRLVEEVLGDVVRLETDSPRKFMM